MQTNSYISPLSGKKLAAVLVFLGLSAFASFATLGDGKTRKLTADKPLLSRTATRTTNFSLKSGYNFRGSQVIRTDINNSMKVLDLNTVMTYHQGGTTYVMPVRKKVSVNLGTQNKVSGATVKINL
ncbi:MAG: hypothetical protein KA821_12480 [Chitinophagaceae bacterium]|nr:hypothetical protein [Chitinophagaceae bacterium]